MVSEKDIEIYRNIKAPSELKDRVLSGSPALKKKNNFFTIKTMSTIAACLMLFTVGSFVMNRPADIENCYVVDYSAASLMPRMTESATVVFEGEGRISAETEDQGFFMVSDGKEIPLAGKKTVNNRLEVSWRISDAPSTLRVNGELYEVKYDSSLGRVTVNKIEK